MEIVVFGYKFNLVILIFIGVVYLILAGHTLCGCCNYGLIETFTKMVDTSANIMDMSGTDLSGNIPVPGSGILANNIKGMISQKEGFVGHELNNNDSIDTSSWNAQNMTVIPGQPVSSGVNSILSRTPQPIPLPENEMLLFASTPFKPSCCPNTYSNSQGCACMTGQQYNYLSQRGMNNVPYSEY